MGNSGFPLSDPVAIVKSLEEGEVSDTLLALESRVSYTKLAVQRPLLPSKFNAFTLTGAKRACATKDLGFRARGVYFLPYEFTIQGPSIRALVGH
jgi:hypothetical protein